MGSQQTGTESERILPQEEKEKKKCSPGTVMTIIGFWSLFVDSMMMSALEPVLPNLLKDTKGVPDTWSVDLDENSTAADLIKAQSMPVAIVFSSKAVTEFIFNVPVGCAIDRYGPSTFLSLGYIISAMSSAGFSFAPTFWSLVVARIFQGIGNAFLHVACMTSLSSMYQGDEEGRTKAFGWTSTGLLIGGFVGMLYGSLMYEYVGAQYPYLLFSLLYALLWVLLLLTGVTQSIKPTVETWYDGLKALGHAVSDKYTLGIFGLLMFIPSVLIFMMMPVSLKYALKVGRWKMCLFGVLIGILGVMLVPFIKSLWLELLPGLIFSIGTSMFAGSYYGLLCQITDLRIGPHYSITLSLNKLGYSLSMFLGGMLGGYIVHLIGITNAYVIICSISIVINCGFIFLRDVPNAFEKEPEENCLDDAAFKK